MPLVYDFWGFPEHYYQVRYDAHPVRPNSPRGSVRKFAGPRRVRRCRTSRDRGLDHGAYVPLVEMFPGADIPVLQISMPTLKPQKLMEIGRAGSRRCGTRAC